MSELTLMQYRNDSGATDDSPFGSALNTPADENAVIFFDKVHDRLSDDSEYGRKERQTSDINLVDISKFSKRGDDSQAQEISPTPDSLPSSKSFLKLNLEDQDLSIDPDLPSFTTPRIEPSSSAMSSSPEIDFIRHQRTSSFYNLPNDPICIPPSVSMANRLSECASSSTSLDGLMIDLKANAQAEIAQDDKPSQNPRSTNRKMDISTLLVPFQILCFLPWCIAVGCALLLFPNHLEELVFSSGYYPSFPRGIERFAHLAEFTIPHVVAFLGFLCFVVWSNVPLGVGCVTLAVCQGVISWQDFREEVSIGVPLGEDDRMSVYWVLKKYVVGDECWKMRKGEDGYYWE